MRSIGSYDALENLGRVRLSKNFFMRDFLYSEISNYYKIPNIPEDPELAIEVGKHLCEDLLEPLQEAFGRITIRSAYRSPAVNQFGNEHNHNCGNNENNRAGHIWDWRDKDGCIGGTVCIAVNWYLDQYEQTGDFRPLAWWIHDHLPYSSLCFFPKLCAFNITWRENPSRSISSYIALHRGYLTHAEMDNFLGNHSELYPGFPTLKTGITVDDYRRAFEAIAPDLTEGHRAMLKAHYHAPHRTITASQLAEAACYEGYQGANIQYGKVGQKVANFLNYEPPQTEMNGQPFWSWVLADGDWQRKDDSSQQNWYWVMHPQVIAALPLTSWFEV